MLKEAVKERKRLFAGVTLFSAEITILVGVFITALFVFVVIAKMISHSDKSQFDLLAFRYLSGLVSDNNTRVMEFFSFLGTHTFLIPANLFLIGWFLFIKRHRWYSINIPVIALTSLLLMFSLKYFFHRSRPLSPLLQTARGYSFPSGHALNSFTFYGLLIYLVWLNIKNSRLRWLLISVLALLIFVIGLSRVYLRVHYASDVLAGYCVGCMWLLLSLWVLNKIENSTVKKVDQSIEQGGGYSIRNR